MIKTLSHLISEHPQFSFEPGMLVLFHNTLEKTIKLRIKSHDQARLWKLADEHLQPVLDDYSTAGVLLHILQTTIGEGCEIELERKVWFFTPTWSIKIKRYFIKEEDSILGNVLATVLLKLWDKRKLERSNS